MNKTDLIEKYFNKKSLLNLKNENYKKIVHHLIVWLLENDQVENDITSKFLFEENQIVRAEIVAEQNLTLAGIEEVEYLLQNFTQIKYKILHKDGDLVESKEKILDLTGEIKQILSFERTMLNILQRMSGVATETKNIIKKIKNSKAKVAATRKTHWGLLDKKAVASGGGLTHRLNLADGILIKDNHLLFASSFELLKKILKQANNTLIEVEVEDEKNLLQVVDIFLEVNSKHEVIPGLTGDPGKTLDSRFRGNDNKNVLAIMLDNFSPQEVKKILSENSFPDNIIFEASGGITSENINEWVKTNVDIISLGSLTHSSKAANISLDLIK